MVFIKPSDVKLFEGIEEFDFVMPNVYADKVLITVFLGVIISISLIIILLNINKFNKFPAQKLNKERIIELISKYGGSSLAHYVLLETNMFI